MNHMNPAPAFSQFLRAECGISAQERDFEAWLGRVDSAVPGHNLLLSDAALYAFEEGVAAQDFALQLLAGAACELPRELSKI